MEDAIQQIHRSPDVSTVTLISRSAKSVTLRVTSRLPHPSVIRVGKDLELVPEFPAYIKGGQLTMLIVADRHKMRSLVSTLKDKFPGTEILSVKREYLQGPHSPLTPRQFELFRNAMQAGYWDSPRRTTLRSIAVRMHLSKSAVSEMLAAVEKKFMREASDKYLYPL